MTTTDPGDDGTDAMAAAWEAVSTAMLDQHQHDTPGRMLRAPGLRLRGGPFYAFFTGRVVVVKLSADVVSSLIAAGTGEPCSPRPGHPMREWVGLPARDDPELLSLVREAREFVDSVTRPRD